MGLRDFVPVPLSDLTVELVGRACVAARGHWTEQEVRALPETEPLIKAEPEVRREILLALAWAFMDESPGSFDWQHRQLLSVVARTSCAVEAGDLQALLDACELKGRASVSPAMLVGSLTPQFRGLLSQSQGDERSRAADLARRAAAFAHYAQDRKRLIAIAESGLQSDPWDLIDLRDDVGPRLRKALRAASKETRRLGELLALANKLPASGKASRAWVADAEALAANLVDAPVVVAAVIVAIRDAEDVRLERRYGDYIARPVGFLTAENEKLLCGLVKIIEVLPKPVGFLQDAMEVINKLMTGPLNGERSRRLAIRWIRAIGNEGSPAARDALRELQRNTRHRTVVNEAEKALAGIAAHGAL